MTYIPADLELLGDAPTDCERCDGAGEVPVYVTQNQWGAVECDYMRCPRCDGSGAP